MGAPLVMKALMAYLLITLGVVSPAAAEDRIMSLDYCADQFVLALADEKQIIGVSSEARDAHSFYRERAKNILLEDLTGRRLRDCKDHSPLPDYHRPSW